MDRQKPNCPRSRNSSLRKCTRGDKEKQVLQYRRFKKKSELELSGEVHTAQGPKRGGKKNSHSKIRLGNRKSGSYDGNKKKRQSDARRSRTKAKNGWSKRRNDKGRRERSLQMSASSTVQDMEEFQGEMSVVDRMFAKQLPISLENVRRLREKVERKNKMARASSTASQRDSSSRLSISRMSPNNRSLGTYTDNCVSEEVVYPHQKDMEKYLKQLKARKKKAGDRTETSIMKMRYRPSNQVENNNTNDGKIFIPDATGELVPFWTVLDKEKDTLDKDEIVIPITGEIFLEALTGAVYLEPMPEETIHLDAYMHMDQLEDHNDFFTPEIVFGNSLRSMMHLSFDPAKEKPAQPEQSKTSIVPMELNDTIEVDRRIVETPRNSTPRKAPSDQETTTKKRSDDSVILQPLKGKVSSEILAKKAPKSKKSSVISALKKESSTSNVVNDDEEEESDDVPHLGVTQEDYFGAGSVFISEPNEMKIYKRTRFADLNTETAPFKPSGIHLNSRA